MSTIFISLKQFVGKRVRLRRDVERYPDFIAWQGMTGVVEELQPNDTCLAVAMDERIDGCEYWENKVLWDNQKEFIKDVEFIR